MTAQEHPEGKTLFITDKEKVLCNLQQRMDDCDHEEADTRIAVHLKDALVRGYKCIQIACSDTDILIILLGIYHRLKSEHSFRDIIFERFVAPNFQKVSLAALTQRLGQVKCQGLPFLHSFTGCDTTSAFKGIGKKKGYDILCNYSAALPTFCSFYNTPFQNLTAEMEEFKTLQRFVILMYSKASDHLRVNEARLDFFFQKNQNLESIPPTENALLEHCKRAIYQCGIWSRCLETQQNLPNKSDFGWQRINIDPDIPWGPVWFTNGEAHKSVRELEIKCKCQGVAGCIRCKCYNSDMRCTMLCNCNCTNRIVYDD